ncbi:hypothetical protein [Faecalibaculum rodentium]|jgi:hypothetical protein|uniref:hypothetical protein n=1 Tax=Faecalibaculum rodentium TaxID=1702221 RepID=UPI00256EE916|nr:hypothetical protein [Faecalibaculum rodentium]
MKKEFDEILQDADLFNDMYASVFFEDEVDTLQLMLSLIRGKEIIIDSVEIQLTIVNTDSKSTRMDVVGHEADESVDIVGFQVILCKPPVQAKRSRYHSINYGRKMLNHGESYEDLQDSALVFICKGDAIGNGKTVHSFTMKDQDGHELGDGRTVIFIDATWPGDRPLKDLMHDPLCSNPEEMVYGEIRKRSIYLKRKEEGMMTVDERWEKIVEERERKVKENLLKEQEAKNRENARIMVEGGALTQMISQVTKYPVQEVERMKSEYQKTGTIKM